LVIHVILISVIDTSYAVARFECDFSLRQQGTSLSLFSVFALSKRKNGKQKRGKYHSAEGKNADCVTRVIEAIIVAP
jgi:hypothetical protein